MNCLFTTDHLIWRDMIVMLNMLCISVFPENSMFWWEGCPVCRTVPYSYIYKWYSMWLPTWGFMMESFGEKFLSQFEVCGSHLCFTAVLSFNYKKASLITSPAFCMFQFHKIAACTALFFSLLHTVGHIVNFYHVSTQPVEHLRCLTSEVHFPSDYKPGITFWLFQTITGWLCCWNNIHWVVELYIVN